MRSRAERLLPIFIGPLIFAILDKNPSVTAIMLSLVTIVDLTDVSRNYFLSSSEVSGPAVSMLSLR